jgi:hypothetical protein
MESDQNAAQERKARVLAKVDRTEQIEDMEREERFHELMEETGRVM